MTTPYPHSPSAEAIQRILFLASKVHIYALPPLTSNKGYNASSWVTEIFTARLRIFETSLPNPTPTSTPSSADPPTSITTEILLEDPSNGDLFASAPYTSPAVVEGAVDSSRFFAVRVVGEGGMKATLGIGFEERGEAIDFGISLQEARKVMGWENASLGDKKGGKAGGEERGKRDWSLKEGEMVRVDVGGRGPRRRQGEGEGGRSMNGAGEEKALFSIKPPPEDEKKGGELPRLAPPPSASEVRAEKRRSRSFGPGKEEAKELGFDDGEFGEFQ